MPILEDDTGAGRVEMGFPFRTWPQGPRPEVSMPEANMIAPRFMSEDDCWKAVQFYSGEHPTYRSVYRFRQFDTDAPWPGDADRPAEEQRRGTPVRESVILDKIFLEVEHQGCGALCSHTLVETRKLVRFLENQGISPAVLYSSGKSAHVYAYCDEVNIKNPHEAVRYLTKKLTDKSGCSLIDRRAQLGVAQLARLVNTRNPKSGLYVIPLTRREVMQETVEGITNLAKTPRLNFEETTPRSPALQKALEASGLTAAREAEAMAREGPIQTSGDCSAIQGLYHPSIARNTYRHFARVALTFYYRQQGWSQAEIERLVLNYNQLCNPPHPAGVVLRDVRANMRGKQAPACPFLAMAGVKLCDTCPWAAAKKRAIYSASKESDDESGEINA